jgi:hypothetical protein
MKFFQKGRVESLALRQGVVAGADCYVDVNRGGREACLDGEDIDVAAKEESSADEKNDDECDLRDDEGAADAAAVGDETSRSCARVQPQRWPCTRCDCGMLVLMPQADLSSIGEAHEASSSGWYRRVHGARLRQFADEGIDLRFR